MGRAYAIDMDAAVRRVRTALDEHGLLLLSDKALPSVAGVTAQGPIKGSWWAHPLGHEIFEISQRLQDAPDVTMLKLVNAKTTFVHRRLWPDLYTIASAHEPWQMRSLSPETRALLAKVRERGSARADEIAGSKPLKVVRADLAPLEERLLVFAGEEHTQSGAHLKRYETWAHWAREAGFKPAKTQRPAAKARETFDRIGAALGAEYGATVAFPWSEKPAKRSRSAALTARARRL